MVSRPITRYGDEILVHDANDRGLDDSPILDQQQKFFLEESKWGGFAEYVRETFGLPWGEEMLDHIQAYR
jgi:hypothetical protein